MTEERPISLNPLNLEQALTGLLKIPDPERTKPSAKPKREKTPPTDEG